MSGPIRIIGLGPAGLDLVPSAIHDELSDPSIRVIGRTIEHPAAGELDALRTVEWCDDLYSSAPSFDETYAAIAARVLEAAVAGPVRYVVPGSPAVGERTVGLIVAGASEAGIPCEVIAGPSFLDAALAATGLDPFDRGLQIVDAHRLPEPLLLGVPTFIVQFDGPEAFTLVHERLSRVLDSDVAVQVVTDAGGSEARVVSVPLGDLRPEHTGLRVSLLVDVEPPGWPGLVATNARLRQECPWDREQTHHSLAKHLLEEAYEAIDAIEALPTAAPEGPTDIAGYVHLEEELGDLLLQVVFHATLAAETEVFGIEEVAESIRRKLVRRHPHVFGDVDAEDADAVRANWETLKQAEKDRDSVLDGVPAALPALTRAHQLQARAASVGFDWPNLDGVMAKVTEELDEVLDARGDDEATRDEVGDLLFAVVNLARHLGVDPELALRGASGRFDRRFRHVEAGGTEGVSLEELDRRWDEAKIDEKRQEAIESDRS